MTTDRHDMYEDDLGDAWDDPVLAGLLTQVREIADQPAPPIGSDLSAVLGGAAPLATARARRSRAASVIVVGLVSTGVLTGGISAAAADELPDPMQRVVARVINTITPFEIPDRDRRERSPDDGAPSHQGPSQLDDQITLPRDVDPSTPPATDTSADPSNDLSNEPSEVPLAHPDEQDAEQDASGDDDRSGESGDSAPDDADESPDEATGYESRGDADGGRDDQNSSSEGPEESSGDEND